MNETRIEFPEWSSCLFYPARYKVIYGGRGSGKSWAIARALILLAVQRKLRILCTREFQNSISESCHELLSSQIRAMGLAHKFTIQQQAIYAANGSEFIFVGTGTSPEKIMSMEGIDIVWIEQAERVSERSFEILLPTVRQRGSEVWCSFNPDEETDPVWKRFVDTCPPGAVVRRVNAELNPWFPPELERERAYLYSVDPESAEHVWGGHPRTNQSSQIFKGKYVIESFTPPNEDSGILWDGPYYGSDFGFANDPTTLTRCWVAGAVPGSTQGKLMVEYEAWAVGCEITDTPRLFDTVPGSRTHLIFADCARPETISHIRNAGFRIEPCEKWSGCEEDGVAFMRSFERIVVHPRCTHTIEELRLYSFKTDRLSGIVLPDIKSGNDHCMDAIRYSLGPLIQPRGGAGMWERFADACAW